MLHHLLCLMNNVLSKYLYRSVVVFIYDILIYSKTKEEHDDLQIILQVLKEHKLYSKFSKCEFFKDKMQYLVHVISKEGISVDHDKIREIMELHVLKDVSNVRLFMGIIDYYRKFIKEFSKIANPITSLQKREKYLYGI